MEGQPNPPANNAAHEAESNDGELDKKSPASPSDSHNADQPDKKVGRRKIQIEFIEDKSRRHITFSKRKAGIMKKAYELSTLTGTQVLLLVASETGHVYTFATPKLQPLITKSEGKNLIQACLNAPDNTPSNSGSNQSRISGGAQSAQEPAGMGGYGESGMPEQYEQEEKSHGKSDAKSFAPLGVATPMNPQFASPPYGDYASGVPYPGMMARGGAPSYGMPAAYSNPASAAYGSPSPGGYPGYPNMPWAKPGAMGVPMPQGAPHSQSQPGQPMAQHGKQ